MREITFNQSVYSSSNQSILCLETCVPVPRELLLLNAIIIARVQFLETVLSSLTKFKLYLQLLGERSDTLE